jgi:hypothetical protein
MTDFPIHTMQSAPARSKPALQQLQAAFGMTPNIAGVMATSPVLINSLVGLFENVHAGSFTEAQIKTVRQRKVRVSHHPRTGIING